MNFTGTDRPPTLPRSSHPLHEGQTPLGPPHDVNAAAEHSLGPGVTIDANSSALTAESGLYHHGNKAKLKEAAGSALRRLKPVPKSAAKSFALLTAAAGRGVAKNAQPDSALARAGSKVEQAMHRKATGEDANPEASILRRAGKEGSAVLAATTEAAGVYVGAHGYLAASGAKYVARHSNIEGPVHKGAVVTHKIAHNVAEVSIKGAKRLAAKIDGPN